MKLADFSLDKKIKNSNANFMAHTKYYLAVLIAILVAAIFVFSFLGFKKDFDYAGGTIVTVVTAEDLDNKDVYNENVKKIQQILKDNKVETSSIQKAETSFGNALVFKILNKNNDINNSIVRSLNVVYSYESTDILEKNYVTATGANATAIYETKMASIIVAAMIVAVAIYVIFRYSLLASLAYLITSLVDVLMVIAATIVCRIPINVNFTTAVIVVFALSTIFKMLLFNQLKLNLKNENLKALSKHEQVILADKEIFSILTIIVAISLIALVLLAGLGTMQIRSFALITMIGVVISALTTFYFTAYLYDIINFKKKSRKK